MQNQQQQYTYQQAQQAPCGQRRFTTSQQQHPTAYSPPPPALRPQYQPTAPSNPLCSARNLQPFQQPDLQAIPTYNPAQFQQKRKPVPSQYATVQRSCSQPQAPYNQRRSYMPPYPTGHDQIAQPSASHYQRHSYQPPPRPQTQPPAQSYWQPPVEMPAPTPPARKQVFELPSEVPAFKPRSPVNAAPPLPPKTNTPPPAPNSPARAPNSPSRAPNSPPRATHKALPPLQTALHPTIPDTEPLHTPVQPLTIRRSPPSPQPAALPDSLRVGPTANSPRRHSYNPGPKRSMYLKSTPLERTLSRRAARERKSLAVGYEYTPFRPSGDAESEKGVQDTMSAVDEESEKVMHDTMSAVDEESEKLMEDTMRAVEQVVADMGRSDSSASTSSKSSSTPSLTSQSTEASPITPGTPVQGLVVRRRAKSSEAETESPALFAKVRGVLAVDEEDDWEFAEYEDEEDEREQREYTDEFEEVSAELLALQYRTLLAFTKPE